MNNEKIKKQIEQMAEKEYPHCQNYGNKLTDVDVAIRNIQVDKANSARYYFTKGAHSVLDVIDWNDEDIREICHLHAVTALTYEETKDRLLKAIKLKQA